MNSCCPTPHGMSRRHFMRHLAGASALALPAFALTRTLRANADIAEPEPQVGDPAVDGRRAAHDRHVGPQAGRTDGRAVQADRHDGRLADLRAAAAAGQADEAPVDRPLDEHPRGRPRPRPLLHAHRLRAQPDVEHPSYGAVVAHELERLDPAAGDSAVRVDRRRERRAGLSGHGLRPVPGRRQRPRPQHADERPVAADGRPA